MRAWKKWIALLLLPFLLASCAVGEEPERIYAVAAIGFDAVDDRIRLSVEVPLVRETDAKEELKTAVFSGEGETVQEALRKLTSGLSKRLVFSHCALMALGENLSRERLTEAFAFADTGLYLPLAAKVVSTPNAKELLEAGSLSAPAVGYEVGEILKNEFALLGIDPDCEIYELRASARGGGAISLPYFKVGNEESGHACSLEGMQILIPNAPPLPLDRRECVAYAVLSGFFVGSNGQAGGYGEKIKDVKTELSEEQTETGTRLTLRISAKIDTRITDEATTAFCQALQAECEALYSRLRQENRGDVCGFAEQLGKGSGETVSYDVTELRVICELERERSGRL